MNARTDSGSFKNYSKNPGVFLDRQDAGRRLATALEHHKGNQPLVLALPRGGVPVAFEIAEALKTDLGVIFVRKIGAPGHSELAIGAIVDGENPEIVLNENVVKQLAVTEEYLGHEIKHLLDEIARRRILYQSEAAGPLVKDRIVIVVDDGIATGATVRAVLKAVSRMTPRRLILAVPLAPPEIRAALANEVDEMVCLQTPEPFHAVSAHYTRFPQVSDEEVIALLQRNRQSRSASAAYEADKQK